MTIYEIDEMTNSIMDIIREKFDMSHDSDEDDAMYSAVHNLLAERMLDKEPLTQISIEWQYEDIVHQTDELGVKLSNEEIGDVLRLLKSEHDATIGISWDTIDYWIHHVIDLRAEYTVWVGGTEVNDHYLSKSEADRMARSYRADGYDDVSVQHCKRD